MALRARPASETPQQTVEAMADRAHVDVPGDDEQRAHRLEGLGPLLGIAAGVGAGAVLGVARAAGLRVPLPASIAIASFAALVVGNGPMTALGITDPRQWSATDWASDVVPHVAYGAVAANVLEHLVGPTVPM